jgi:hypothetical protein
MSISIGLCPNLDLWNANKLHYITPNTFKLIKHMNTDIIESANISPGSSKEIFLLYYKEL